VNAWTLLGSIGLDSSALKRGLSDAKRQAQASSKQMERDMGGAVGRIERRLNDLGRGMQAVGKNMSLYVTGPIVAAGAAAVTAARQLGEYSDAIIDASAMTGLSTDRLQSFEHVARTAGVSTKSLTNAAMAFQRQLMIGGDESKKFTSSLDALGVSLRDGTGELRTMESMFPEVLAKLADMESGTERNAIALATLGRGAGELIPVLELGSAEIQRLSDEAASLGHVLDIDTLRAANDVRIGMENMTAQLRTAGRSITVSLLPVVMELVEAFTARVVPAVQKVANTVSGLIDWFKGLSDWQRTALGGLVGALAATGPLLMGLGTLLRLLSNARTTVLALKAALVLLSGPGGVLAVIGVAIGALAYAWKNNLGDIQGITKRVMEQVRPLFDGLRETFGKLTEAWNEFARVLGETATPLLRSLQEAFGRLLGNLSEAWTQVGDDVVRALTWLVEKSVIAIEGVLAAITTIISAGASVIENWETVTFWWREMLDGMGYIAQQSGVVILEAMRVASLQTQRAFSVMFEALESGFAFIINAVVDGVNVMVDGINSAFGWTGVEVERVQGVVMTAWAETTDALVAGVDESRRRLAQAQSEIGSEIRHLRSTTVTTIDIIRRGMARGVTAVEAVTEAAEEAGVAVEDLLEPVGLTVEELEAMGPAAEVGVQGAADAIEQELVDMLKETESDFTLDHVRDVIFHEEDNDDMMKVVAMFDRGGDASELSNVLELVTDAWNYFPHEVLGGISPAEKLLEHHKKTRK